MTTNEELENMTPADLERWAAENDEGLEPEITTPVRRRMTALTVRLPEELLREIRAEAAQHRQPYQRYLRALLQLGLSTVREGRGEAIPAQVPLTTDQVRELNERGTLTLRLERQVP